MNPLFLIASGMVIASIGWFILAMLTKDTRERRWRDRHEAHLVYEEKYGYRLDKIRLRRPE